MIFVRSPPRSEVTSMPSPANANESARGSNEKERADPAPRPNSPEHQSPHPHPSQRQYPPTTPSSPNRTFLRPLRPLNYNPQSHCKTSTPRHPPSQILSRLQKETPRLSSNLRILNQLHPPLLPPPPNPHPKNHPPQIMGHTISSTWILITWAWTWTSTTSASTLT